jgi:CDP-diacylglycerol--serine O-phosphatidyltransferase
VRLVGRAHLRRGVLILPSLLTLGNMLLGFHALMEAGRGRWAGAGPAEAAQHFERAAVFIALALLLDGLDGRIARFARATSPIGLQLDSLADVVSFGVAPAVLVFSWALVDMPRARPGWAVAFVFTACGALRLARFNVQASGQADGRYFVGLPIPAAAGAIAASVYARPEPVVGGPAVAVVALLTILLALLMVSTIRYPSLKKVDLRRRQPLRTLIWAVLVLAVLTSFPEAALGAAAALYVASGPALRLFGALRHADDGRHGGAVGSEAPADDGR